MNRELPANLWTFWKPIMFIFRDFDIEIWIFKGMMGICRVERLFVFGKGIMTKMNRDLSANSWVFWEPIIFIFRDFDIEIWIFKGVMGICCVRVKRLFVFGKEIMSKMNRELPANS